MGSTPPLARWSPRKRLAISMTANTILGGLVAAAVSEVLRFEPEGPVIALAAALAGLGAYVVPYLATKRFNVENTLALALVRQGQYQAAEVKFDALARRFARRPVLCALARHNHAYALQRRGELDEALRLGTLAEPAMATSPSHAALSALQLAVTCALRGDVDAADAWIQTSHARAAQQDFLRIFPEAVVHARAGRHARALELLDAKWHVAETHLTAVELRRLRVVRAFAMASATGPRDAGTAETVLRENGAPRPGEFAALAVRWPEMRAFLDGNGL